MSHLIQIGGEEYITHNRIFIEDEEVEISDLFDIPCDQSPPESPAPRPAEFNKISSRYFPLSEVVMENNGYTEHWNIEPSHFQLITAPIVKSARELLLSDKLLKVKECSNCGWLFLDTTKNGKKRWCSMDDCGSKMKALEYYYRKKREQ